MQEYGGYIEFEYFHGKEYHEDAIALNSGRHCVEYLIRTKGIRKLYIPRFMCDSITALCEKMGVEVAYYGIDANFQPLFCGELNPREWLYIVNFYGQVSEDTLKKYKQKYDRVIADNAQAFFEKPVSGIDACYTCRKFFGVADGGYLYTDERLEAELPQDYSYDRMEFLLGRLEKGANPFYGQYVDNNRAFATEPLKRMSKLTKNILCGLDYQRIMERRTENFKVLHEAFCGWNKLSLRVPQGAFMYPLYVENGVELRKKLQEKKIYVPTLWPYVFEVCKEGDLEWDMAKNILPLPVDQRYGVKDMQALIREIKNV